MFACLVQAQNTIGLPEIIHYTKQAYGGGTQTWGIAQGEEGTMYFANNEGLLTFDGARWRIYPLPNATIVRSVLVGPDKNIYVGGQGEFGFFSAGFNAELRYTSLSKQLPEKDRSLDDVWDICAANGAVYFRANNKIVGYTGNGRLQVFGEASWVFLGEAGGRLVAQDGNYHMRIFRQGSWEIFSGPSELPVNSWITGITAINQDSLLVATQYGGLYLWHHNSLSKIHSAALDAIARYNIYGLSPAGNSGYVLATSQHGIYIVDKRGNLMQALANEEGVQNNNVLAVFLDRNRNIWLGTDNGIDMIAYNNAIRHIPIPGHTEAAGYSAVLWQDQLYLGTSNGLYSTAAGGNADISFSRDYIKPVANTAGQVWSVTVAANRLLVGHNEGAFRVQGQTAQKLSDSKGFWNFFSYKQENGGDVLVAGTYGGLSFLDYRGKTAAPAITPVYFESSRFLVIDGKGGIWVAHPYKGLFYVPAGYPAAGKIRLYDQAKGIASISFVCALKGKVVATTASGIVEYNERADRFVPSAYYKHLFGTPGVRYIKEDGEGNLWFVTGKRVGVVDFSHPGQPVVVYIPELDNRIVSGFEFIYPLNRENVLVGGEQGFFHINYASYRSNAAPLAVQVRQVRLTGRKDSLLYGGGAPVAATERPVLKYTGNALHFEYAAPFFAQQASVQYAVMLEGFDRGWSPWTARNEKDYTNLPPGRFVFRVKARNNLGRESNVATYAFEILPPWYRSLPALLAYVLAFIVFNYVFYRWLQQKFRRQREAHRREQEQLQYLHRLERDQQEKEIVKLKNEKLEAEIALKNAELASQSLHLVQKGDVISRVKEDLVRQLRSSGTATGNAPELKKMVRVLSEEERVNGDWESFAIHFDKTHGDFLQCLKAKHPLLTPGELKLSAYLRLNMTSKDIAALLNISVRGVELSRYRLRKKLGIATEVNLFDYLLQIKPAQEVNKNPLNGN